MSELKSQVKLPEIIENDDIQIYTTKLFNDLLKFKSNEVMNPSALESFIEATKNLEDAFYEFAAVVQADKARFLKLKDVFDLNNGRIKTISEQIVIQRLDNSSMKTAFNLNSKDKKSEKVSAVEKLINL